MAVTITSSIILLICVLFGYEISYRLGLRKFLRADVLLEKEVVDTLQPAVLGLFALLIGFTFSMALDRFSQRRDLILHESNAIGTAYLRADFLSKNDSIRVKNIFRKYVQNRIELYNAGADKTNNINLVTQADQLQSEIWSLISKSDLAERNSDLHALVVESVNEVIDLAGARTANMVGQIPKEVLLLLNLFAVASFGVLGYRQAFTGTRALVSSIIYMLLI